MKNNAEKENHLVGVDILKAAEEALPWQLLDGKNILVTGATGLLGSCVVGVLMANSKTNCHVYAAGRNAARAHTLYNIYENNPRFHFLQHDVTEPLNTDVSFHYIIHAASGAAPAAFASTPVEVMKANFLGTANLMDYGLKHEMQRFLYVSTGEVYGEGGATMQTPEGMAFIESDSGYVDCATQRACYPSSKRAAETLCMSYAAEYGVDVVIARPCHLYGAGFTEADNRVYAQFLRNVQRGEDIVMKSTGSQFRSWCYVVDAVRAMFYILFKGERGKAYNIADEASNITIRQLAEIIASAAGRKVVIDAPAEQEAQGYNKVTKSIFSTERLQRLGWKPMCDIFEKLPLLCGV